MKNKSLTKYVGLAIASIALVTGVAYADAAPEEQYRERIPVKKEVRRRPAPVKRAPADEWKVRVSPAASVWFIDEEDEETFGGLYIDTWNTGMPVNFRVGAEVRHVDLNQAGAAGNAEFPGKTVEATLVKIPFAIEYYTPVGENMTMYVGGGPDILNAANDVSDTSVGLHLSSRLHYAFNQHWGLALEAGYMWGELDGASGDIDLDHAFISPQLAYTF